MSSAKLEEERVEGVFCHSLHHLSFASMLGQYRRLLFSAYGPKGGTLLISNAVGRETLALSSSDITKQLSFRHPCSKYVNALISAQNASCGLNGLYTGMLCTRLLEEALSCEEITPHHVIADVSEWVIMQLLTQMAQFPEQVVIELDIGDMKQVSSFVKTILGSKGNFLHLTRGEMDNFSLQIVRAFLKSIPQERSSTSFGHVTISQEGAPGSDARVFDGLLYREPEFDPKLLLKISMLPKAVNILLFAIPLLPEGGTSEVVAWSGSHTKEETFVNSVVAYLISFLKEKDVHILANQKAIHPVIKFEIERRGYIVLERLGTMATDALIKLSGCQAVTNFSKLSVELNAVALGKLSSVQHVSLGGKNYILLKQEGTCFSTLLLPKVSPSIEATLKETAESCLAALKMVVVDGKVVAGGGCLETWLAAQVTHLVTSNLDSLVSLNDVPSHHVNRVANCFVRVFMEIALQVGGGSSTTKFDWCIDSVFHHLWPLELTVLNDEKEPNRPREAISTCVCGLLTDEDIKHKYAGNWYELDFEMKPSVSKGTPESSCLCETLTLIDKTDGELSEQNSKLLSESATAEDPDLCMDADSLDEKVTIEEDIDSLEKTLNSVEEEGDSLEGRLESLDDDVDSLEDMLDKVVEPVQTKCSPPKITFDSQVPNILYDSYLAKYNAMRLALEGFSQLFQVGQCVFDR